MCRALVEALVLAPLGAGPSYGCSCCFVCCSCPCWCFGGASGGTVAIAAVLLLLLLMLLLLLLLLVLLPTKLLLLLVVHCGNCCRCLWCVGPAAADDAAYGDHDGYDS